MKNDMREIAARIQGLLSSHSDTQGALATALGIDESAVSRLLSGQRGLAATELAALCSRYGVSSDLILFGPAHESGALLRAEDDADVERVVAQVQAAFDDLHYVRALVGG